VAFNGIMFVPWFINEVERQGHTESMLISKPYFLSLKDENRLIKECFTEQVN
jgi:hypothetical protein